MEVDHATQLLNILTVMEIANPVLLDVTEDVTDLWVLIVLLDVKQITTSMPHHQDTIVLPAPAFV